MFSYFKTHQITLGTSNHRYGRQCVLFFLSIRRMKNAFAEIVWLSKWLPLQRKAVKLFISAQRDFIFASHLRMIVWYRCKCARAPKWFKDTESWNKRRLCIIYLNLHASMKLKLFHPCKNLALIKRLKRSMKTTSEHLKTHKNRRRLPKRLLKILMDPSIFLL